MAIGSPVDCAARQAMLTVAVNFYAIPPTFAVPHLERTPSSWAALSEVGQWVREDASGLGE